MIRTGMARTRFLTTMVTFAIASAPALVVAAGAAAAASARQPAPLEIRRAAAAQPWQRYKVDSQGSSWPQAVEHAHSTLTRVATAPHPTALCPTRRRLKTTRQKDASSRSTARGGSCVACHVFGKDAGYPAASAPISAVGATRSDDWLFNYIYDPRNFNKDTIVPPWEHRNFTAFFYIILIVNDACFIY